VTPEIEKLLSELQVDPYRLVTCEDVSALIKAVVKVGDEQTAQIIRYLVSFITGVLQQVATGHQSAIVELANQTQRYVDGRVDALAAAVREDKQETWQ
jgi:hypothetical protein